MSLWIGLIYFLIEKHFDYIFGNIFVKLNKQAEICCFLINSFEKVLHFAELDARKYYGIKLLQSIVIHPVKCMATYIMNFFYLVTSFSLIEKWSLHLLMNLRATKWSAVCQSIFGCSQFYPFWTDTDPRQLPFYNLPFLVLAPSSDLTLLEKVLKRTCFWLFHILSWSPIGST